MTAPIANFNVLGVTVSAMNLTAATDAVLDAVRRRRKGYVCVTGVHGIIEAQDDPEFLRILNGAFLNTTDGMPLVWLARHYRADRDISRVYGPDLMLAVFAAAEHEPVTHFFYGGVDGVAEQLKACLLQKFPDSNIVGTYCPPFRPLTVAEADELVVTVSGLKPDIIWVGLSTPKQERFMAEFLPRLDTTLMFGVGAAFDFHSGKVSQAPRWMQRHGLEWLHRLCSEPRRLWKRYLLNNPRFLYRITGQLLGLKKYPA
ncbi:MAG: WecB/TagA/CpsF family glycosyltransferase [Verrucomicrobiales bacterium]|jgi:N-acetylglucosaminyldiphosphoundecaprenol N-acetyl-beta-D-mannosaminyltransferase|nr:WecB/TagA/CpsF family glycosyltransferase [Verrucomicrobiales bacterium]